MTTRFAPSLLAAVALAAAGTASAQSFEADVAPLVQASCVQCHGVRTVTPLSLAGLDFDLTDHHTFQAWEKVYERLERGEMPPAIAPQPDPAVVETALGALKRALVEASLVDRGDQRTPLRRLTRLEYGYTIQDLLQIDEAVAAELATLLPAEADSGGFDTVAAHQSMSPLHVQSYLTAADQALDAAIAIGPPPPVESFTIEYVKSRGLARNAACRNLGCGAVKPLDDGFATFHESSSTFLMHSRSEGFAVPYPGRYRVAINAYAYQANTPVTLTVYLASGSGALALDNLVGSFDFVGDVPRSVELTPFLRPGDTVSPAVADADALPGDDPVRYFEPRGNFRDYKGEGIALRTMTIEGPLLETWPPLSTRALLTGLSFDEHGDVVLTKAPYEHVVEIVERFATRAFRRPLEAGELEAYAGLAEPLLAEGRPFVEALRLPLRAILSAPPFLYQAGTSGELDTFALATRLSYFLWRSMPDDALLAHAEAGRLFDAAVLAAEVERMLDDPRTERFVKDFVGQSFRLYELRATAPDPRLYPEYDDRLGQAMERETELFLTELIARNESVGSLIDTDFAFLNRRLAEHYGVAGVEGQEMRRVSLPAESPRGGLLTQASILKVTANGTTTSPVPRGNFVLTQLLGQEPPPPPPGVAGLEPDTRGTTTIREQLDAHRTNAVCASCHRKIDPPGFALEAFDPIGGFRTHYRVSGGTPNVDGLDSPGPYTDGPPVDTSGVTPKGDAFSGIAEYKQLLSRELDQVARHLTSQLLVFSTGADVEFVDRDTVEAIVDAGRVEGHPVRSIIHQVAQSDLFRRR